MTGWTSETKRRRSALVLGVAALLMVLGQGFGQLAHVLTSHAGELAAHQVGHSVGHDAGHSCGSAVPEAGSRDEMHVDSGAGNDPARGEDKRERRGGHGPDGCGVCSLLASTLVVFGGTIGAAVEIPTAEFAADCRVGPVEIPVAQVWSSAAPRGPPRA